MLDDVMSMVDVLSDLDASIFGPSVKVIRTLASGDTVEEVMQAAVAVDSVLRDPINGDNEVVSARIEWPEGVLDVWGISM